MMVKMEAGSEGARMRRFASAVLAMCLAAGMLAGAAGCAQRQGAGQVDPRLSNGAIWEADGAMRGFAVKTAAILLGESAEDSVCYSPASLYLALSLLELGTEGGAQQQLLDLLGFEDGDSLDAACAHWLRQFGGWAEGAGAGGEGQVLEIANSVWANAAQGCRFTGPYEDAVRERLGAKAVAAAFDAQGNEEARQWALDATHGLIGPQDPLPSDAMAALLGAVRFKGLCTDPFDAAGTVAGTFFGSEGAVSVDMMRQRQEKGRYRYSERSGLHLAKLSFEGGASMVFALPGEGTSLDEAAADEKSIADLISGVGYSECDVRWTLPRFTLESDVKGLVGMLARLGVTDAFGLGDGPTGVTMLGATADSRVSEVRQWTRMDVCEDGAETAAATEASALDGESMSWGMVDFTVDQPFLFALLSSDGLPLLVGRVGDLAGDPVDAGDARPSGAFMLKYSSRPFDISISSIISYDEQSGRWVAWIENVPGNRYALRVSIALQDGGEVVYESPALQPDEYLESIGLARELPPGEYPAMATFAAIDPRTGEETGETVVMVTLARA